MKAHFHSTSSLRGTLRAPSSKSYTHRAYCTALLAGGGTIRHPLQSDDTDATLGCLEDFTVRVEQNQTSRTVTIESENTPRITSDEIYVGESGTLLRFLLPICTVLDGPDSVTLIGEETLRNRSNQEPVYSLREAGFRVDASGSDETVPITCYPGQRPETYPVDVACSTTSQYLSGWLLALAGLDGGTLRRTTELVSAPYVSMTEDVLGEAGVSVEHPSEDCYRVSTSESSSMDYEVPGDYSSAAFFLVGACLGSGEVRLRGLNRNDRQADRRIVSILEDLGVDVAWKTRDGQDEIVVSGPSQLGSFAVDASDCPDLAPILTVLGTFSSGKSVIENVEHLTNKESDRINRTAEELRKTGVDVETGEEYIAVTGTVDESRSQELYAHGDHRLAMSFSILALTVGNITVNGVECVAKSYPNFYRDLSSLNANFELVGNDP
ncbi:MAG: 3-phosphoshikimate 1-carboxyvinyltransferase [bacterium]